MLIQIMISLIISYLLHSIPISKPKKTQKSIHLSLIFFFLPPFLKKQIPPLHVSLSLYLFLLHRSSTSMARSPVDSFKKKSYEVGNEIVLDNFKKSSGFFFVFFITLLCHISITTLLIFFIWSNIADLFKRYFIFFAN